MEDVKNMQPLVLAFVGDAVHTLFVREFYSKLGDYKVNKLNRMVKEKVNAGYQSAVYHALESSLSEAEREISTRARNSVKGQGAKNYSVAQYNYATAFEALVGYLYLIKDYKRLEEILNFSVKEHIC